MKRAKKLLVLALAALCVFVLASCTTSRTTVNLEVMEGGSGVLTMDTVITAEDNDGVFPQGTKAVAEYLQSLLEGTEWQSEITTDGEDSTLLMTLEFDNMAALNEGLRSIVFDEENLARMTDATYTESNGQGTFTITKGTLEAVLSSFRKLVLVNEDIFTNIGGDEGPWSEENLGEWAYENGVNLTVAGSTTSRTKDEMNALTDEQTVSVTGSFSGEPVPSESVSSAAEETETSSTAASSSPAAAGTSSQAQSDGSGWVLPVVIAAVAVVVIAVVIVIVVKGKKKA